MKRVVINNRTYRYPDQLEELSLQAWQTLLSLHSNPPNPDIPPALLRSLPLKNRLGCKTSPLQKMDPPDRQAFLSHWSLDIAQQSSTLLTYPPSSKQPPATEPAKHSRWRCLWPRKKQPSPRYPLKRLSAQALCDATDLYLENFVEHAPLIAAILSHHSLRYDEDKILKQAEKMKTQPMRRLIPLFHELLQAHQLWKYAFPACYHHRPLSAQTSTSSSQTPPTWNDLILWLANYLPSAIQQTEHLPCYEFMRIVDAKIRKRLNPLSPSNHPLPCIEPDSSN